MPGAHSANLFSQKSSTETVSPTRYVKLVSWFEYAKKSGSGLSWITPSSSMDKTTALLHLHLRPVALERFASSGIRSFIISPQFAFFHPTNAPVSGQVIGINGTFLAPQRSARRRLARRRSAPRRSERKLKSFVLISKRKTTQSRN